MEFPHGREGYCEEEEEEEEKHSMFVEETAKHPFQFSPSSSCSSSFHCKGVVAQPDGRWGAQIYDKHQQQQVWLGSFESEENAARACDDAALRLGGAATDFKDLSAGGSSGGSGSGSGSGRTGPNPREREHMFDKVVTPSDVGKLNRLVIPKQHAEKYFPLESGSNDKGLLLNFEDPSGKPWRFRYSYWNSSQSYVMTKGWSRFVKEKKLDAGDIVSFERGVGESGRSRLFIDWKRRPDAAALLTTRFPYPMPTLHRSSPPWANFFPPHSHFIQVQQQQLDFDGHHQYRNFGSPYGYNAAAAVNYPMFYQLQSRGPLQMGQVQEAAGDGGASKHMVFDSVSVVHGKPAAAGKRLRLFGVNLDYPTTEPADATSTSLIHQTSALAPNQSSFSNGTTSSRPDQQKGKESLSFDLDS